MVETEYTGLEPAMREALRDWCRLGGELHLYGPVEAVKADEPIGLGLIKHPLWVDNKLETAATCDLIEKVPPLANAYKNDFNKATTWPLLHNLEEKNYLGWFPIVFLILFGLIVGPFNLFFLARSGKRHRLFLTTTVISLAACLLLLAMIFIQDGTGGKGHRMTLAHLPSGEAKAAVWQEQVARSGLLLGSDFTLAEPSTIEPVILHETRWTKVKASANAYEPSMSDFNTSFEAGEFSGDWFQSRTEQGHSLRSIIPTRMRIDIIAGADQAAPRAVSSVDVPLTSFFYRDVNGQIWEASTPLLTGQEVVLKKSDRPFTQSSLPQMSESLRREVADWYAAQKREVFWAWSDGKALSALTIETLKSIEWPDSALFVFGEPQVKKP
jgi:hypothetical protein